MHLAMASREVGSSAGCSSTQPNPAAEKSVRITVNLRWSNRAKQGLARIAFLIPFQDVATEWVQSTILNKPTARTSPFLLESNLSPNDVSFLHSIDALVACWVEVFARLERRLADRAKARGSAREEERALMSEGSEDENNPDKNALEGLSVHWDDEMQLGEEEANDVQSLFKAAASETDLSAVVALLITKVEAQENTIAEFKEKVENGA